MVAKVNDSTTPLEQTPETPSPLDTSLSNSSFSSPRFPPIDTNFLSDLFSGLSIMSADQPTTIVELDTTSKPARYDGTRDGFKCLAWLKGVKRYFAMKNIPEGRQTMHAVNLLNHTSLLWWESLNHDDDCPYTTFTTEFKKAYMPNGFLQQVRGLLLGAKLTSDLAEYLTRLRLYMNILLAEDPSGRVFLEATAIVVFLQGCPDDLHQMLQADQVANPTITFVDMCAKAEGFDAIYAFGPKGATKGVFARFMHNTRSSSHSTSTATPTHDPMAMEIDNIGTNPSTRALMSSMQSLALAVNAMSSRFNTPQAAQQQQQGRIAPLTPEERIYIQANNGCFKCRRLNAGHFARDCGRNQNNPRQNHSVNNVATASTTTDQSGNASSN